MPLLTQAAHVLEIVASSGSIRKASERVNLAPSAINRHVLNLERELGTPLFLRHAKGMNLTEAGKLVVDYIRDFQTQDQTLRSEIEVLKGRVGHVRLGIMECFAEGFLATVYDEVRQKHGSVAIDVVVAGTSQLVQQMLAGELDLVVAFNMPGDIGFRCHYETRLDIGVVMKPTPELRSKNVVGKEELQGQQLVLPDRSLSLNATVKSMIQRMGLNSQAIAKSNSVSAIKQLVIQGAGVSFLTWADVRDEVTRGDLLFCQIEGQNIYELLTLSGRNPAQMSETTQALAKILVRTLEEIEAGAKSTAG
ncbi:LysR family transcriptional regulator [uncultured Ruegeria sp.]|uniref:LysR family transcriptional regulator n=1 Tax=uncultured Ruegeria sp. TaxID=259304 RepID=UPI0026191049|nr:LysR family transcriptional regulator [uncultured Ruegeria sp.]